MQICRPGSHSDTQRICPVDAVYLRHVANRGKEVSTCGRGMYTR